MGVAFFSLDCFSGELGGFGGGSRALATAGKLAAILPLPKGEGWGEGEERVHQPTPAAKCYVTRIAERDACNGRTLNLNCAPLIDYGKSGNHRDRLCRPHCGALYSTSQ